MATVNIYLNFNGNCEEAFNFYKSVFGGEIIYIGYYRDMPQSEGHQIPESEKNKVMHVGMSIGDSMMMGSDTGGEWAPAYNPGNNFAISISAENREEADRIFGALAVGGQVTMPMEVTFWGEYFGMLTDRFGINWMMSFRVEEKK
ncbi:MAG: VOC family protein [Tannerella sp.]|jgi:PhnB protein|nr:VOC family protein [Tannerella sp.]